jgi:arsenite-transporting ATPase
LIVANLILPPGECTTPYTQARRAMQDKYLEEIVQRFSVPMVQVPLLPREVKGLDVLERLGEQIYGRIR